jgi:CubicO group peptidase (beta-lactamase class C family)
MPSTRVLRALSLALAWFVLPAGATNQPPDALEPAQAQAIAAAIASYRERTGAPSVSVHVDRGGQTVYRAAVGSSNIEHDIAAGPGSVYAIGSITKSYTAHAVLQFVADGRLGLGTTVGEVLPEYSGPGRKVTVEQLLVHTSGLPNYVRDIPGLRAKLRRNDFDRKALVATFEPLPLAFRPGERWSYTNAGYYLLGLIVERLSGKSYYEYLKEDVLQPLGVAAIWSGDDTEIVRGRVHGYEQGPGGLRNAPSVHYLVPYAAGSLWSTAEEVARYRRAVFQSERVSPRLRELILSESPAVSGEKSGYLLGALVKTHFEGRLKYAHSGEIWGYASTHAYYPDSDTTIVVLTNLSSELPTPVSLEREIARTVLGLPAVTIQAEPGKAEVLAQYAGRYELGSMQIGFPALTFKAHEGQLWVGFGDTNDLAKMLPLQSAGKHRYVAAPDPETGFVFDPPGRDGKSGRVVMDAYNGRIPAVRATNSTTSQQTDRRSN